MRHRFPAPQLSVGQPEDEIQNMKDSDLIDAFIAYLRMNGHPDLFVELRPDEKNRHTADIDAIAGKYAIEHTSIDTVPNQRRDSDWFVKAAGGLENELKNIPHFRLKIVLEYDAITTGQNWSQIRDSLKNWITEEAPDIVDGHHIFKDIPGIPFSLHIMKASDRDPRIIFGRFSPADETLPDRIFEQFERKAQKLSKYRDKGFTTILLVESDDLALMDDILMLESIKTAYPKELPGGVDKLWFADTSIKSAIEFVDFTPHIEK